MERETYVDKLRAQLNEWEAEIAKLEAKARQVSADAKLEMTKQIGALRSRRDALRGQIAQAQDASADAWGELRKGLERAGAELKAALDNARAKFR